MWIDDSLLDECHRNLVTKIWIPKSPMVVLGNSNKSEKECYQEACEANGVPILKRYGGGGTVVLHDGCLVVSFGFWVRDYFENDYYFKMINESVIKSLTLYDSRFSSLYQDGLSDLCFDSQKVAGTSLFRSRNYLLYQASLLVDKKIDLLEKYLKHPSKEPEYRAGKSHRDFVTDLRAVVPDLDFLELEKSLSLTLERVLKESLSHKIIESVEKQRNHLYQKSSGKILYA